ncbi:extracellular matrix regulator RemB [Hydrogenoanaerobacterium sp.]|uniref:extracellular matrix regulator RemB n=1 Tax=Hydrogenoanaerobacterium sp. TaxID=2953763 RepID=UPI00289B0F6C|nr:extracellular matrix/biofilm biosynthesis regulator RemA family protein [Hydrogenoanaerobacterium sp.]
MYLHLGQDTVVRTSDIIGIFDIDNTSLSRSTRGYLAQAQKNNLVVNVTYELPKSFVVCCEKGKQRVYISQISSATLKKRSGYIEGISNV